MGLLRCNIRGYQIFKDLSGHFEAQLKKKKSSDTVKALFITAYKVDKDNDDGDDNEDEIKR